MARSHLRELAAEIAHAVGGARPAASVSKATWSDQQRSVSGPIADIARLADEGRLEAPATLIVGDVVETLASSARVRAEALPAAPADSSDLDE